MIILTIEGQHDSTQRCAFRGECEKKAGQEAVKKVHEGRLQPRRKMQRAQVTTAVMVFSMLFTFSGGLGFAASPITTGRPFDICDAAPYFLSSSFFELGDAITDSVLPRITLSYVFHCLASRHLKTNSLFSHLVIMATPALAIRTTSIDEKGVEEAKEVVEQNTDAVLNLIPDDKLADLTSVSDKTQTNQGSRPWERYYRRRETRHAVHSKSVETRQSVDELKPSEDHDIEPLDFFIDDVNYSYFEPYNPHVTDSPSTAAPTLTVVPTPGPTMTPQPSPAPSAAPSFVPSPEPTGIPTTSMPTGVIDYVVSTALELYASETCSYSLETKLRIAICDRLEIPILALTKFKLKSTTSGRRLLSAYTWTSTFDVLVSDSTMSSSSVLAANTAKSSMEETIEASLMDSVFQETLSSAQLNLNISTAYTYTHVPTLIPTMSFEPTTPVPTYLLYNATTSSKKIRVSFFSGIGGIVVICVIVLIVFLAAAAAGYFVYKKFGRRNHHRHMNAAYRLPKPKVNEDDEFENAMNVELGGQMNLKEQHAF